MTASSETTTTSYWRDLRDILGNARAAWRLLSRRDRLFLGGAALLMGLVSACNTAFPLLLGQMLNHVKSGTAGEEAPADLYRTAATFLLLIGGIFLVREIIQFVRQFLIENACSQIKKDMTVELFAHLVKLELSKVSQDKIGALHSRITRCVGEFVRFIKLAFLDFFPPLLTGAFALAAGLSKEPILGLAMALVIPLSLYLTIRQIRSQNGIRRAMIRSQDELSGIVVEQMNGLEYVRAANTHEHEIRRVDDGAENLRVMEKRHHVQMSMFSSAKAINEAFFHLLVISLATYLAIKGTLDYGDILTYSFLFANVMAPLNEIHRSLDGGHECSLMVAELVDMLNEPPDRSFATSNAPDPKPATGQPILVMRDLVVEFDSELGRKRALNGINMVINHGETIGLAGPSGGGKTTWLRILLRLIHPSSGSVQIAAVPLDAVSRSAIGHLIGYVSQAPFVFAGTIEDNIRYGAPKATAETVQEAAQRACIHDEIMEMPAGYQTVLKERGSNLSAGQRQRLALARTFLKDPPILILDEGTSALDNINERNVQKAIDLARKDRTVILVAHRLSTLLDADRIYIFREGKIVETGTYEELFQQNGYFTELINSANVGTTAVAAAVPNC
jgi:ATP-binding cassette, subfamily B, bacterial